MPRRFLPALFSGVFAFTAAGQITVPPTKPSVLEGYPPEEEEANPARPKRRIVIEEEGPPPVTVPRGCYYVRMEDLARAAAETKNPDLKAVLASYVVAFDRLVPTEGPALRVCPVPLLYRDGKFPEPFGVFPLNENHEPKRVVGQSRTGVRLIEPYEELLIREADRLFSPPATNRRPADDADALERATAAEHLMSAAVLFYDTARDLSKRRGKGWDKVRADAVAKLAEVRLKRLKLAAERKDWAIVRALGARMANLYPNDLKLLEEVFAARLAEGVIAAKSEQLTDLERAGELLREFESRFPGSKNAAVEQVRTSLQQQKEKLFRRAQTAVKTDDKDATRLLRTLEAIDPNYPGLRDLQSQVKQDYKILMVGVNRLPSRMSPFSARSDADRMAVELLFESLVDAIPDDALGVRYRPGLAAAFPGVISGARDVRLQRLVEWAGLPRQYADASDVAGTLRYLKGDYRHTWGAACIDWLADSPRVEEQNRLRLELSGGHPYPLSLLNFKILPARWLAANGLKPDEPKFDTQPYGSGPYKVLAGPDGKIAGFVANPAYGRRPGKLGQPFIKEIRFVDVTKKVNIPGEFKTEQLHLLPDIPTADIGKYNGPGTGLIGRVNVVTAAQNRRIWMLALNHRKPALRSLALRRGLSHAIDRELILNQAFRAGMTEFHRSMRGPFPYDCWATPKLPMPPAHLFNKDLATAKLNEHSKQSGTTILRLAVPAEDPRALLAAEMIKKQVELCGASADGKITISLDPLAYDEFNKQVYGEASFDLAYVPMDYPDDWYPFGLAALLDPAATGPHGRNVGAYLDKQANTTREDQAFAASLNDIRHHADPSKITQLLPDLHRRFLEAVPFVPLWQLDRHMVIASRLQISFDTETKPGSEKMLPPSIFVQVGRWKLD